MSTSQINPSLSRKRLVSRILRWGAGLTLCLLLLAVVARSLLIHWMRLPRLTISQSGNVMAVAVAPDGQTIFSGDDPTYDALRSLGNKPADVFVWQGTTGRLIRRLHGFYWRSSGVAVSPDGRRVIANGVVHQDAPDSGSFSVIAWDWQSGQQQWDIEGDTPLSYSQEGRLLGCANGIFSAANGKLICRTSENITDDGQSAFTPDGKMFGIIDGYNADPKTGRARNPGDDKSFYSTMRLHFWRTDTGKEARDFSFTRARAFDIARDGQWLILVSDADGSVGGTDGSVVRRVDIKTGEASWTRVRHMNGPDSDPEAVLNSVVVSPNGRYVVLASTNSHLIVLDAQTGHETFRPFIFPSRNDPDWALPGGLAFSSDGKTLVSRCGRKVLVWDASVLQ